MNESKGRTPKILGAFGLTLSFFLISIAVSLAVQYIKRYVDFTNEMNYACLQLVYQFLVIILPMIIYTSVAKLDIKETFKFKSLSVLQIVILVGMGIFLMFGANYVNNVFLKLITLIIGEPQIPDLMNSNNIIYLVIMSFSIVIIAPIFEELFTRGIVQSSFKNKSFIAAAIFTSLIFGLMHMTIYQLVYAFILGIFLSLVVKITGSIWASIIIHFICNFISTALSVLFKFINLDQMTSAYEETNASQDIMMVLIWLTMGIMFLSIGLILLWALVGVSKKRDIEKLGINPVNEPTEKLNLKEKLAITFTIAAGAIVLVLTLL